MANFLILVVAGYFGLVVIFGALWLILPPLNEMSMAGQRAINAAYGGYVSVWGLGAIASFFTAFSGFSIVDKIRNWRSSRHM